VARALNLGILAHVDAGKTTLTERLLFTAGVIDAVGRVDDGTTQTDTLALERQRGITIKAAVVSFTTNDVAVNLIDTPGHPDFIAEVERALSVLDGAVLVISAVEGVQAQTRVLLRTLQRLHIPTLLFVNKIDRRGAREAGVVDEIAAKLTPSIVAMGRTRDLGTPGAAVVPYGTADADFSARLTDTVVEHDDALLAAYVQDEAAVSYARLRQALVEQTRQARVYPVFFGSAISGAGVQALLDGLTELLPATDGCPDGPAVGRVFKVERGAGGEKIAYVRLFGGTIRTRDRLCLARDGADTAPRSAGRTVTAIRVFDHGTAEPRAMVAAGQIGKVWGLSDVQIGDVLGPPGSAAGRQRVAFAPPTLEAVVVPRRAADGGALHTALTQLAEQDPLINLRQDDTRHELSVSLYGEVQKEVIQATLASDYHLEVDFRETVPLCIERPIGSGAHLEVLRTATNPLCATVGLRIEPAPRDSGIQFRLEAELATMPLFIYRSVDEFAAAIEAAVRQRLQHGLYGWPVTDCRVSLTHAGYISPTSTAADFRKLVPLVLMRALAQAGTVVGEPILRFRLEGPADALGATLPALGRLGALPLEHDLHGAIFVLEGEIAAARLHRLQQEVPRLTRGEGVLESTLDHYEPLRGDAAAVTRRAGERWEA